MKIKSILHSTLMALAVGIVGIALTGCTSTVTEKESVKDFKEPTLSISKDIVRGVEEHGSIKLDIQNMCMNNPDYINHDNYNRHASLSLLVTTKDNKAQALSVNIKSPLVSKDLTNQGDILVYIVDISNIHYVDDGNDYIEIKDSPHKYYEERSITYHSYTAEIYINKNKNKVSFGSNEYTEGKNNTVTSTTEQLK